jgi:hypothetical protein
MKYAIVAMLLATPARAQTYTQQRLGGMIFTTGSNGYHAMSQQLGGMTFGASGQGSWMTQDLGDTRTTTYVPFGLGDPDKD